MALAQKKYEGSQSKLWIVEKEKAKSKNVAFVVGILLVLVFVLFVLQRVVTNSSEKPESELIEASGIDWNNPPCLPKELSSQWKETTHPAKIENTNDKEFTNTITQEVIEFHPRNTQGENKPHWHRKNPSVTNRHDYYLDKDGNPVGKNSKDSHIYTNC